MNRPLAFALLVLAVLTLPVTMGLALALRLVQPIAVLAYLAAEDLALLAGGHVSVIGTLLGRPLPRRTAPATTRRRVTLYGRILSSREWREPVPISTERH